MTADRTRFLERAVAVETRIGAARGFGWECEACICRSTRIWPDRAGADIAATTHNRTYHGGLPARHR